MIYALLPIKTVHRSSHLRWMNKTWLLITIRRLSSEFSTISLLLCVDLSLSIALSQFGLNRQYLCFFISHWTSKNTLAVVNWRFKQDVFQIWNLFFVAPYWTSKLIVEVDFLHVLIWFFLKLCSSASISVSTELPQPSYTSVVKHFHKVFLDFPCSNKAIVNQLFDIFAKFGDIDQDENAIIDSVVCVGFLCWTI